MHRSLAVLFALVLTACATGPKFKEAPPPRDGEALVYVYRINAWALSACNAVFAPNPGHAFVIGSGSYSYFYAPAGALTVTQTWPSEWSVSAVMPTVRGRYILQAGETKYLRFETETVDLGGSEHEWRWRLLEIPPETGRQEIMTYRLEKPNEPVTKC